MALISCPECESSISDKCVACPHCGYPLREMSNVGSLSGSPAVEPIICSQEFVQKVNAHRFDTKDAAVSSAPEPTPPPTIPAAQAAPAPQPRQLHISVTPKLKNLGSRAAAAVKAMPLKKMVVFLAAACVVVIAVKICLRTLLTPYLSAVGDYLDAFASEDMEDKQPLYAISALSEDMDFDEFIEENDGSLEDYEESRYEYYSDRYGDDFKYSYRFVSAVPMADYSLAALRSRLNSGSDGEEHEVKRGVTAKVRLTLKGEERVRSEEVCFDIVKIDGEWMVYKVTDDDGGNSKLLSGSFFYSYD